MVWCSRSLSASRLHLIGLPVLTESGAPSRDNWGNAIRGYHGAATIPDTVYFDAVNLFRVDVIGVGEFWVEEGKVLAI